MSPSFALLVALLYVLGIAILGYGIRSYLPSRRSQTWPAVEGTILACELRKSNDSDGPNYRVDVKYSYSVAGREFKSDRLTFGYSGSGDRLAEQKTVDRLRLGKPASVRYNPADPAQAVLFREVSRTTATMIVFGSVWLFLLTIFALYLGLGFHRT